jgi:hippurate hydrolase
MTPHLDAQLRTWRRDLHRIPETAFEEHATATYVADVLETLGFEVSRGVGGTGVVGSLTRGASTRSVGLRADMDALPIAEVEGRTHGSTHPGRMHACGHDGHMAMVLGAAATAAADVTLDGTVRVIFQPAEEPGRGAQAMIDDGLLERFPLDALHGLHNLPGIPTGHLHTRAGGIMASEDNFTIVITGRGGHAARPDAVIDPLVVGAEIVLALQTVVARTIDPLTPVVLSCTEFHTDGARNAIPGTVSITGDTRSFDPTAQTLLERRIREISVGIAAAHGATAYVTYTHEFAPTSNDPERAGLAARAAATALGKDRVDGNCLPIMPSEDFGVFARHIPSCFSFVGNGTDDDAGGTPLHSRTYDFNDDALTAGVAFYTEVLRQELTRPH